MRLVCVEISLKSCVELVGARNSSLGDCNIERWNKTPYLRLFIGGQSGFVNTNAGYTV